MLKKEKDVLKLLAFRIAEISSSPINQITKRQWHANNSLKPLRPMFMIDQLPWNELDVNNELKLQCEDPFCQELETILRQLIYRWEHMRDDFVYEPVIYIPMIIKGIGYGLSIKEDLIKYESGNDIYSHHYYDMLQNEEDLEKLKFPQITLNEEETKSREIIAHEIFDGILDVIMDGYTPCFNPWDEIVQWRGCDTMLYDFVDRPDFMHKIMKKTVDINLSILEQCERKGLLSKPQQRIHCSGGWSEEIPSEGYDPNKPRSKDIWTFGMAQIFTTVSPKLHNEYEIDYAIDWYSRFALGNYGCCEPLDDRLEYVKRIPNIRKISMSPWVKNRESAAEQMESKYVFLNKPNPAYLIADAWDQDLVKNDLMTTLEACKKYKCPLEYVLKDVSTVNHKPQVLWKWVEIARKVCEG